MPRNRSPGRPQSSAGAELEARASLIETAARLFAEQGFEGTSLRQVAEGADVTPALIGKFRQVGDVEAVAILERIYRDEIGHVRIGNHWYRELCRQRSVDAESTFRELLERYMGGRLRGPFNWPARIEAGFDERELAGLERMA